MVYFIRSGFILLLIFSVVACTENESELQSVSDYIIFGKFFGECIGENCIETYLIQDEVLYEDQTDPYAGGTIDHEWQWEELSQDKYEVARDIQDLIPPTLLAMDNQTFGMPDAGDWGGIFLEVKKDGEVGRWLLDLNESTTPKEFYSLSNGILEIVENLNQ
jgi:hypothetical protein